jgi:hypothetical protein
MANKATLLDFFREQMPDGQFDVLYNNGIGLAFRILTHQRPYQDQIFTLILRYMMRNHLYCYDADPQPFESGMIICRNRRKSPHLLSVRIIKHERRFLIAISVVPVRTTR